MGRGEKRRTNRLHGYEASIPHEQGKKEQRAYMGTRLAFLMSRAKSLHGYETSIPHE